MAFGTASQKRFTGVIPVYPCCKTVSETSNYKIIVKKFMKKFADTE
jgi:hypothetical protein